MSAGELTGGVSRHLWLNRVKDRYRDLSGHVSIASSQADYWIEKDGICIQSET